MEQEYLTQPTLWFNTFHSHGHLRHGDALLHQDTALLEADRSRLCVSFQFGTTGKKLSTVTSIPFKIIEEKATSEYIDPWLVHSTANQWSLASSFIRKSEFDGLIQSRFRKFKNNLSIMNISVIQNMFIQTEMKSKLFLMKWFHFSSKIACLLTYSQLCFDQCKTEVQAKLKKKTDLSNLTSWIYSNSSRTWLYPHSVSIETRVAAWSTNLIPLRLFRKVVIADENDVTLLSRASFFFVYNWRHCGSYITQAGNFFIDC